jgi:hypothetical protein
MPERNLDILRDLKKQVHARRKNSPVLYFSVLDARSEDPASGILGTSVFSGTSRAEMLLFDAEFKESVPPPRTRIVQLKAPMPVGATVTGNDLAPLETQTE